METIDNLPLESSSNSKSHLTLSSLDFRLLLATVCADRIAYYGLRSVIIFYAINEFGLADETAFYHYSFLTLIVYSSQLLGGFLGDFVLGARNGILVGLGLCILGALLIFIEDSYVFYASIVLFAVGSGFFKTNTFSLISHYTAHDKERLEKRFISMYTLINLGAFVSSLFIGLIGEKYGYVYSFMLVLAFYAVGTALIFAMSEKTNTTSAIQREVKKEPKPIAKSLLVIIVVTISCGVFWILFEKYSYNIANHKIDFFTENASAFIREYMWSIPVVLLLLLSIPYYFLAKRFSTYVKLAISMILIGICWAVSALLFEMEILSFGFTALIIFMLMEAIADIFLTPTALTLLTVHSSKKYYGTIFGVYSGVMYLATRAQYHLEPSYFEVLFNIGLVVLLIASIVMYFVLPLILKEKKPLNTSLEEEI